MEGWIVKVNVFYFFYLTALDSVKVSAIIALLFVNAKPKRKGTRMSTEDKSNPEKSNPGKVRKIKSILGANQPRIPADFSKITTTITLVTPESARTILDNYNTNNRKVSKASVAEYARYMGNNEWIEAAPDAIAFDLSGKLVNGQHRLMAVCESNKPTWFVILYGFNHEAVMALDNPKKRHAGDAIRLMIGDEVTATGRTILSQLYNGSSQDTFYNRTKVSNKRMVERYQNHKDALDFACGLKQNGSITKKIYFGLMAKAYYVIAKAALERFNEIMYSGVADPDVPGEVTVLRLRDFLLFKGRSDFKGMEEIARKMERALEAFVTGEDLPCLRMITKGRTILPVGEECFDSDVLDKLVDSLDKRTQIVEKERALEAAPILY